MADKKLSEETYHPTLTGSERVRISALLAGILTSGYATVQEIANKLTALTETSGPTALTIGAIADGEYLKRVGTSIVSAPAGGTGGADILQVQIFS